MKQPARISERVLYFSQDGMEDVAFAKRRQKSRRRREIAKASRKKNRRR